MFSSEIIITKLGVDDRRRLFVNKEASKALDLLPGDEIVLSHEIGSDFIVLKIQRQRQIVKIWVMNSTRPSTDLKGF
jgi:hypothetical protein